MALAVAEVHEPAPPDRRVRGPQRRRRLWRVTWMTIAGGALLTAAGLVMVRWRDTDFGDPTRNVTSEFASGTRPAGAPELHFSDVTEAMGLGGVPPRTRRRVLPEDTAGGVAWGDYDGDGRLDLFATAIPPPGGDWNTAGTGRLWRNLGDRFTDVTLHAGVADGRCLGMGASFADYDADGRLDLYVTCYGPNRLYRNRGDGTFEQVAEAAGVADTTWSTGAAWGDVDGDGHLDLYVANYVDFDPATARPPQQGSAGWEGMPFTLNPNSFSAVPNRLYRNRGNGTFEEIALPAGVSNPDGRSLAATFVDFDGDNRLDLYVNNDVSPNALFHNIAAGAGRAIFEDLSSATGSADPRGSMGLCVADLGAGSHPPDGRPDLFITHWIAQENALYQTIAAGRGFEVRDRTRALGLGEVSLDRVGWGCVAADVDLDGRLDLVVANGSTLERADDPMHLRSETPFLFWNDGRTFHDVAPWSGPALEAAHDGRGLAAADFDGDGDLDLAIARSGAGPLLLRNDSPRLGAALAIRLAGLPARLSGARVEVTTAGNTQVRWYGADVSYLSAHGPDLVFGLGASPGAEHVSVRWADGTTTTRGPTPAGSITIVAP
ncbi:MAG: CRTAC1 family protein [Acidobacteria bacterium]|nr:CRTAC1 family protein [Acidobacteriota bacterium]